MRDTVRLDWRVPSHEWDAFREYVADEYGGLEGYLGREAEAAMREYADTDGYDAVEDKIDRLVQAAGRTPEAGLKEKISDIDTVETTRVTARVDDVVKDDFRSVVDAGDDTYGVAFAKAIRARRGGGRAARLDRKLDRILDDAEGLLSQLADTDDDGGLSVKEKKTITICNRLGDQFTDEELVAEIHDVAGQADKASKPTVEKYREMVVDRLDVEPHPHAKKTVWVPESFIAELGMDTVPRECRRPPSLLDRDELERRIQLSLGRRAATRSSGIARADTSDFKSEVLDDCVTRPTVLDMMEAVALDPGFELDRTGNVASLRVTLKDVADADADLFETIVEYRDTDADELLPPTTDTTMQDFTPAGKPPEDRDSLFAVPNSAGSAATDGGSADPDVDTG